MSVGAEFVATLHHGDYDVIFDRYWHDLAKQWIPGKDWHFIHNEDK